MSLTPDNTSIHSETDTEVDELITLGQNLINTILDRAPLADIKTLIAEGAPLWYQDDEGTSALHAAAYVENDDLIRLLIEGGAVWNAGRFSFTLKQMCKVYLCFNSCICQLITYTTLLATLPSLSTIKHVIQSSEMPVFVPVRPRLR